MKLKLAVFIISYKATDRICRVLNRFPKEIWDEAEEVYIFDDCSEDDIYYSIEGYNKIHKKKVNLYINERNLGYGGNQKRGYNYAIKKGYDIVAMIHGDGQYAPEELPRLLDTLKRGKADMVFGSRINDALKGGMPLYKYVGNRILTKIENLFLKLNLSEYHSGYRVYRCDALKKVPFNSCADGFQFDTEILIAFKEAGLKIAETDIPTFYGDEISRVKVWKYGYDCIKAVFKYWLFKKGWIKKSKFDFAK